MTERTLRDHVMVISGGSRGIGLAIALRAARDGARVVLIAKTGTPHPKLEGTIYTAATAVEQAGGAALPINGDVRDDAIVETAVGEAIRQFGRIDICVNNASAIDLTPSGQIAMKRYDLMQDVNARATFLLTRTCAPHLARSPNPHVLTLSPPLNLHSRWLGSSLAYTISKYAMSLCTLGFARELGGVGVNSLWPRTMIATSAVRNLLGGEDAMRHTRSPEIMADAAHAILTRQASTCSGNFFIDEDVLHEEGITDLSKYAGNDATLDLFLD